jgi:hypothetical protein
LLLFSLEGQPKRNSGGPPNFELDSASVSQKNVAMMTTSLRHLFWHPLYRRVHGTRRAEHDPRGLTGLDSHDDELAHVGEREVDATLQINGKSLDSWERQTEYLTQCCRRVLWSVGCAANAGVCARGAIFCDHDGSAMTAIISKTNNDPPANTSRPSQKIKAGPMVDDLLIGRSCLLHRLVLLVVRT